MPNGMQKEWTTNGCQNNWAYSFWISDQVGGLGGLGLVDGKQYFLPNAMMYIPGKSSSFRSMLRGGAVSEESLPSGIPDGAQPSGSIIASSVYMLSEMTDMIRPLSQDNVQGDIDGEAHTAAKTCGDGTCGLHALFGLPARGELYAIGVREILANSLKEDLSSMMACLPSLGSKALLSEILKTVWRELKDVADRSSQNQDPDIDGRHLWKCCPDDVKESLLGFSRTRQVERDQQTLSTQELISFCHDLFVPGHVNLVIT